MRQVRQLRSLGLIMAIIILGSAYPNITQAFAFKRLDEGQPAIDFVGKDLTGAEWQLSTFKGSTILLAFIKHPSLRCGQQLAVMQKLFDQYSQSHGLFAMAVYVPRRDDSLEGGELEELKELIEQSGATFPVLIDEGMKIFSKYGVITFPSTCIIDSKMQVSSILPGLPTFGGERNIKQKVEIALGIEQVKKVAGTKYKAKGKSDFYYNFANRLYLMAHDRKALARLKRSISEDPDYYKPYKLRGMIFLRDRRGKKLPQALEAFRKSLALKTDQADVHYKIGQIQIQQKHPEAAMETFKAILEIDAYNGDAHFGMAEAFRILGQQAASVAEYREAITLFTSDLNSTVPEMSMRSGQAYVNLSKYYLSTERPSEAIEALQLAGKDFEEAILGLLKKR